MSEILTKAKDEIISLQSELNKNEKEIKELLEIKQNKSPYDDNIMTSRLYELHQLNGILCHKIADIFLTHFVTPDKFLTDLKVGDMVYFKVLPKLCGEIVMMSPTNKDSHGRTAHLIVNGETYRLSETSLLKCEKCPPKIT